MNRALLDVLQRQRTYPSVTVLLNTTPERCLTEEQRHTLRSLTDQVSRRLRGDVSDAEADELLARLEDLVTSLANQPMGGALAVCVSLQHAEAIRLGRPVQERVVIDDTFATRDLVADLNRTALFRVVTVSERKTRLLVGDRVRLLEERNEHWPMQRGGESAASWARDVARRLAEEQALAPMPTVIAGVDRTIRRAMLPETLHTIGLVAGNHDRTGWADLHTAAWPLVTDWLRNDTSRAVEALDRARSNRLYAGGIDEIWSLAIEGRIETLAVEESYSVAVRVREGALQPAEDPEAPDVVDDIIDDTIEAVLRFHGNAIIVPDGTLAPHARIGAVVRF
ncbi:MAG: hypothetical protein ACKV2O_05550 [Acidimicrobiales bacterium]